MGKSSKIARSGMQGFVKQKKLQKNAGGIHKQPIESQTKEAATKASTKPAKPAAKPKAN